ncbi:MAG: riboflavin synthase [Synergistes sp.]|nr:riboflavin synthase [Synergistes sp.]
MFTGLIETKVRVASVYRNGDIAVVTIAAPLLAPELKLGDSVSLSGVCSTVTEKNENSFSVELMPETQKRTKFSDITVGSELNAERAMKADSRFDGHIVAGHVDGTAVVSKIENLGKTKKYYFSADKSLLSGIVEKGSVTIDGVSLTVIDAADTYFSVGIIPTTLSVTTLGSLKASDTVNIETDIVGKYINKFMEQRFEQKKSNKEVKNTLTWDKLNECGWL